MNSALKFSVIVPCYNVENTLPHCIESLLKQTYTNLEIILIDDGSADSTPALIDRYALADDRIVARHQSNMGVSKARNLALQLATGDYLSFVDSDDFIEANMYQVLAQQLEQNPVDILKFGALKDGRYLNELDFEGVFTGEAMQQKVLSMIGAKVYMQSFIMGVLWMYVFRRSVVEDNHIRFDESLHRCEDRLFSISVMLKAGSIAYIHDALYNYCVNMNSLSNRYDPQRWQQELHFLEQLRLQYRESLPASLQAEADQRLGMDFILRAFISIDNIFFTRNSGTFFSKYRQLKTIISHPGVRQASRKFRSVPQNLNKSIILKCIVWNMPFLLSCYNQSVLKIRKPKC